MLIFCCIWSSSLCTLALHIAGSLWRLDFNHSSLFRPPSSLRPPPLVHPIYMRKCLWSIYLSLPPLSLPPGPPLVRASCCDSDNIFPVRYFPSGSHPGIAEVECLAIHTCFLRVASHPRIAKGFFLLARKASKFRGTEGSAKWPIRCPGGPKRDLRIAWN